MAFHWRWVPGKVGPTHALFTYAQCPKYLTPSSRKGTLKPINVAIKIRGGHKAVTVITGFEEYSISTDFLTDELKRICASSATSGLIQGQAKGGESQEVLVQGKHLAAVRDLLTAQGIPKRLIHEEDKVGGKKKR